ncbi:MAG: hypothetical protein EBR82_22605 [Caulobacteraceae bacterium]|nr:hypothetical protein [Caulobacteraceae bacterium]
MKELHVYIWPGHKLPSLSMCDKGSNEHALLATFKSIDTANQFIELCKGGIVMDGYSSKVEP